MTIQLALLPSILCLGLGYVADAFIAPIRTSSINHATYTDAPSLNAKVEDASIDELPEDSQAIQVTLDTTLTDIKTKKLFSWIKCAFEYSEDDKNDAYAYYYNNIELAIAAAFGDNLQADSLPTKLMDMAMKKEGLSKDGMVNDDPILTKEWEETLVGDPIGKRDRESASLGAMGAAQWTGQFMTRPHCKCEFFVGPVFIQTIDAYACSIYCIYSTPSSHEQ